MTSPDRTYDDWLYVRTLGFYFRRTHRLIWFGIILLLAAATTWKVTDYSDFSLLPMFTFSIYLYIFVIVFFILNALLRSLKKKEEVRKCVEILQNHRVALEEIKRYKQRAAVDAETAQTFMLLPILLLTLAVPGAFSTLSYMLDRDASSSSAKPIFTIEILEPFVTRDGSIVLALIVVASLLILFLVLDEQLERASISVVIQHACIEYEAIKIEDKNGKVATMMCEHLKDEMTRRT